MTRDEREFMRTRGRGKPPRSNPTGRDLLEAQREWGREGMRKRWGDHGPTKCVRAFEATVDRFRAHVASERDRAAAATEALDNWLDDQGAEAAPRRPAGDSVTISAVLTYHWYGEIESGRKRVEYRDISDYWTARLWDAGMRDRVKAIRFSRGYTNTRMTWEVTRIVRDDAEGVYEIHLGKRIS